MRSGALLLTAQEAVTRLGHVKSPTRIGTGRPGSHDEPQS